MLTHNAELDKALFLCSDKTDADAYLNELKGLFNYSVTLVTDWEQLLNSAQQETYAIIMLQLGSFKAEDELTHLKNLIDIQPGSMRVGLYRPMSMSTRVAFSECCHRLYPLDIEPEQLGQGISESARAQRILGQDKVRKLVGSVKVLPSLPDIYVELNEALSSPKSNARIIAGIIEKDMAMAAKILQLVNSACFVLERNISSLQEAVSLLGVREVRDLVLTNKVFEHFPQDGRWSSFAFDHIRDRSVLVAGLAREICRTVKASPVVTDQAFLAALLQDFGMLIFATHDPEGYQKVMQEATDLNQPLYAVEKMRMGVSHTEAGAYLLSLWNISPAVIETVLFHHFPASSKSDDFSALTAVHVADAILPNVTNVLGCQISSRLSYHYLERLGLEDKINHWQQLASRYKFSHPGCGGVKSSFA
ncbi:HDOD domain-containing protein [Neptuniibacter sp. QD72_48]|uniref:HDOD domain-containing protein n=1 Tax=Neptuniibacter sp. QD72_48 TaxID=3398214 RepID=UPI0039F61B3C